MAQTQIIGIILIHNEDLFIERVIRNVLDFCDRIYVCDHHSTDQTGAVVRRLAAEHSKIDYRTVDHPSESHDLIAPYAGGPYWVMGVDGDEVYDPAALRRLRAEIQAGVYDQTFKLTGNVLNVKHLDVAHRKARGYLAPPCRSMIKLYNFSAIASWPPPCPERLHGGTITYRPGYGETSYRELHKELDWDHTPLRCLHLCFTHRSSLDTQRGDRVKIRKGVGEATMWAYNLRTRILSWFGHEDIPYFKRDFYMRGPLVEKDITPFNL